MTTLRDWEKEFNEKIGTRMHGNQRVIAIDKYDEIKEFIKSLLSLYAESLKKEIEKKLKDALQEAVDNPTGTESFILTGKAKGLEVALSIIQSSTKSDI